MEIYTINNVKWDFSVEYWKKQQQGKSSYKNNLLIINWLDQYLQNKYLHEITTDLIEKIARDKEKQGVKGSTVNKTLALIKNILKKAEQAGYIEKVPHIFRRDEPLGRDRWLKEEEAQRLISVLPAHQKDIVAFALATGLRKSNILKLEWDVINFERKHAYIKAKHSKNKKPIAVPLNTIALDILNKRFYSFDKHERYVFTYQGKKIQQITTKAWRNALKLAGIKDFRFHDLRHTWASWHIQNGTTVHELQQLGGWSKMDMVQRYAHLSSDHLRMASENIKINLSL